VKQFLPVICLLLAAAAQAKEVRVDGYTKRDGTYVAPYTRTAPNTTPYDNWSTKGNVNPYTGRPGTIEPNTIYTPRIQPVQPLQPYQPYRLKTQ